MEAPAKQKPQQAAAAAIGKDGVSAAAGSLRIIFGAMDLFAAIAAGAVLFDHSRHHRGTVVGAAAVALRRNEQRRFQDRTDQKR
jgi:hypothetical protein